MKFFKHYTTADSGSLHDLMNRHGVEAYGRYWLFVQMCVEKLGKSSIEDLTEDQMVFTFNSRQLRDKLRTKSVSLQIFLRTCSELTLFLSEQSGDKFTIYFPKILEILDRDAKRARKKRGSGAESTRLEKEEDKDKNKREKARLRLIELEGVLNAP